MKNEERFTVGGYLFGNGEDAKRAREEEKTARFLQEKIDYREADTALRIYEKAVEEKIFKTPVGFDFLRDMQKELDRHGVPEEKIKPIPLYLVFSRNEEEKPVRIFQLRVKPDKSREYLRTSVWLNMILALLVMGMFIVTLFGESTNMMNYRFKLENEFSSWEQELTERENQVREKERELKLEEQ